MTNLKSLHLSGAMLCCFLALSLCGSLPSAQANTDDDFLLAVGNGNEKEVARLLSKGADVNTRDEYGYTALHFANKGVAKLLIAKGADLNARNEEGRTPLHVAVKKKSTANLLIANGADINAMDFYGYTPLHMAVSAYAGNKEIAETLIANGADINAKENKGRSPLHIVAIVNGGKEMAEMLIAKGADINSRDALSRTPLHFVAGGIQFGKEHKDIAEILIAKGADIDARDDHGRTPLHVAAETGNKDIAEILIARGADLNARDGKGFTPFHIAVVKDAESVGLLLIAKGADTSTNEKVDSLFEDFYSFSNPYVQSFFEHITNRRACVDGEITVHFDYVNIKGAFDAIADYSGYKLEMPQSLNWSGPINFVCKPWKKAAQDLADKHHLILKIKNGTIYLVQAYKRKTP